MVAFSCSAPGSMPRRTLYTSPPATGPKANIALSQRDHPRTRRQPEALVVNIFGPDRAALIHDVCRVVFRLGFNLDNSSWLDSQGQMSILLTISKDNGLMKADALRVENAIKELDFGGDSPFGIRVHPAIPFLDPRVHCTIEVIGLDRPGIVAKISGLLADNGIDIITCTTNCSPMPPTGVQMFTSTMMICLADSPMNPILDSNAEETEYLLDVLATVEMEMENDINIEVVNDPDTNRKSLGWNQDYPNEYAPN